MLPMRTNLRLDLDLSSKKVLLIELINLVKEKSNDEDINIAMRARISVRGSQTGSARTKCLITQPYYRFERPLLA